MVCRQSGDQAPASSSVPLCRTVRVPVSSPQRLNACERPVRIIDGLDLDPAAVCGLEGEDPVCGGDVNEGIHQLSVVVDVPASADRLRLDVFDAKRFVWSKAVGKGLGRRVITAYSIGLCCRPRWRRAPALCGRPPSRFRSGSRTARRPYHHRDRLRRKSTGPVPFQT